MKTSGTYNFQSISLELLIREAFERISVGGEKIVPMMLESARRSVNFILLSWMNKTTNLWTLETEFLPLIQNQGAYPLTNKVQDIVQVSLRTSNRVLGGAASSSAGGVAAAAFDGDSSTHCLQTSINGTIFYDYAPFPQAITFIGICSFSSREYTLEIGYVDNSGQNQALIILPKQSFLALKNYWFSVFSPVNAIKYYVKETGGETLDISEIYFNNQTSDILLSNASRYDYYSYPQKYSAGRPCIYYLDKQAPPNVPTLYLWPVPDNYYSKAVLFLTYKKMMQDAASYQDTLNLPALFYPALVSELAYRLSIKYNPEISLSLKEDALSEFLDATAQDSETTPLSITPNYGY